MISWRHYHPIGSTSLLQIGVPEEAEVRLGSSSSGCVAPSLFHQLSLGRSSYCEILYQSCSKSGRSVLLQRATFRSLSSGQSRSTGWCGMCRANIGQSSRVIIIGQS